MPYFVYMVTDSRNYVLYVGVTRDLERRMSEHRSGEYEGFTQRYHLVKLVYAEEWNDVNDATLREKQLKGWRREKKDALIRASNPQWEELMPWK